MAMVNDPMFIEKIKNSTENLKNCCYSIDLDNARGLGEQLQYAWENWKLKELRLPKLKVQESKPTTKIPTREEIGKKVKHWNRYDIFNDCYVFYYRYT